MNPWHRIGNKVLTLAFNKMYGTSLTDLETCYKAFTREAVTQFELGSGRWGFGPEITAKFLIHGHSISEVPVSYEGRGSGDGKKLRWADGCSVLFTAVRIRFFDSGWCRGSIPRKP